MVYYSDYTVYVWDAPEPNGTNYCNESGKLSIPKASTVS